MNKWKTLKSEYVHKSPFGNIRKDECELPNGIVIDDYYVNEYSDWVNAVVITKENEMVLVEQYRYAGNEFYLEVPAGKIEENETYEEAIIREVREETGFISESKPILLGEFMVNPATQNNKVITFLLLDAFKEFEQDLDDTEILTIKIMDFNEMTSLIRSKQINTQLFTAHAYTMAKMYLMEKQVTI
ncbi:NUDIX hydrolase [Solibacillus isronensis]|uniref:NUDIX hydrolase n=1 Tax=Solibacillus isronensis TaxID=412383 RepID=UPI002040694F|nr:NUDIX hydrolase [Solibacillus isronensis]MCM3721126.1 NUDIX hydrolase [Solibacillus isronensis]